MRLRAPPAHLGQAPAGQAGQAPAGQAGQAPAGQLPELARVYWRPRVTAQSLRRAGWLWTLSTIAHTVPFVGFAAFLTVLKPVTLPVALIALVQAWMIPELYAARGANVLRPGRRSGDPAAERAAAGLLADLLCREAWGAYEAAGLVFERGTLGVWLLGEAGAVLIIPGGRRVFCYCVKAVDPELPSGDRIAHLLLALREDEIGFATVANLAFSGAPWRLRRRLAPGVRPALAAALAP